MGLFFPENERILLKRNGMKNPKIRKSENQKIRKPENYKKNQKNQKNRVMFWLDDKNDQTSKTPTRSEKKKCDTAR